MHASEFEYVASLVKREAGIVLAPSKEYLFNSRLSPLAKSLDLESPAALVARLRAAPNAALVKSVVDAMTTNESLFFRDKTPFDTLRDHLLPAMMASRQATKRLRIWSAACSSGQEPYSIAMLLDGLGLYAKGWTIDILGTDISDEMVGRAIDGRYSKIEVMRGLPVQLLVKYFDEAGTEWRVKDTLRQKVRFKNANLLHPLAALGTFDIIFCRNVLIYFDKPTKEHVLNSIADRLSSDGSLFLGSAETLLGLETRFVNTPDLRGVYQRADAPARAAAA